MSRAAFLLSIWILLPFFFSSVAAQVVRLEIKKVHSLKFDGYQLAVPPSYEWLIGQAWGELDPEDPRNAGIVNLDRAPTNAHGRAEYRVDVAILKPID